MTRLLYSKLYLGSWIPVGDPLQRTSSQSNVPKNPNFKKGFKSSTIWFFQQLFKGWFNLHFSGWWFGTFFMFPFSWECHHPSWRTPSFFRGVGWNHQPDNNGFPAEEVIYLDSDASWTPAGDSPGRLWLDRPGSGLGSRFRSGHWARATVDKTRIVLRFGSLKWVKHVVDSNNPI